MKKWFIGLLTAMIACSSLSGCKKKEETYEQPEKYRYTEGVHDYTAPVIESKYLVKNGGTEYKILMPQTISEDLRVARDELIYFFNEATNIELTFEGENEAGKTHDAQAKYISLGNTKMLQSTEITADKAVLGENGCRIATKDNTVYITGTSDQGTLFAVYDFLSITFNYEWYDHDYFEIDRNVLNVKLRNFNVFDKPDFDRREYGCGLLSENVNNSQYRSRFNWYYWNTTMPIGDTTEGSGNTTVRNVHNSPMWLPLTAPTTKPEWISTNGVQLCYTARGSETLYNEMVDRLAFVLIDCLKKYPVAEYPNYTQATLTIEDEYPAVCDCSGCRAAKEKYGTDSGAAIVLCNNLMAKARVWMDEKDENGNYVNEKYRREKFVLRFFAYSQFVAAPAHYDEAQGKYVVNHPDLVMRDDVGVWHAINNSMQYQLSIYSEENKKHLENSSAWFDISPNTYIWTYAQNYWEPLTMFDSFNHYTSDAYQWYKVKNVQAALQESIGVGNNEITAFQSLKMYLASKLYWDCTLDEKELTDKWFNAMYREGAPYMRQLFNDMRANAMKIWNDDKLLSTGTIAKNTLTKANYTQNMLNTWMNYCNSAIEAIEATYRYNPELKAKLVKNAEREWVSPAYCALRLYSSDYSKDEYENLKNNFLRVTGKLGNMLYEFRGTKALHEWALALV